MNRDYRYGVTATLHLRTDARLTDVFDVAHDRWIRANSPSFTLAPGDAQLIGWGTAERASDKP